MKKPKGFLTSILTITGAIIVGALLLYSSPTTAKPTIEWTPPSMEIAVSQGQSQTISVDFTASEDVSGEVTLRVVPTLQPYISVNPASISGLTAGTTQTLEITATTASDSPLGIFDGTIQLRSGKKNRAKPLPVVLTILEAVWPTFESNEEFGLSLQYPPAWNVESEKGVVVVSNVAEPGELSEETLQEESFFEVKLLADANPLSLPIGEWFEQHRASVVYDILRAQTAVNINGYDAIEIEVSEVGGRRVHIYVDHGKDVLEISYGLFATRFNTTYAAMVDSLRIAP